MTYAVVCNSSRAGVVVEGQVETLYLWARGPGGRFYTAWRKDDGGDWKSRGTFWQHNKYREERIALKEALERVNSQRASSQIAAC